ncbi:S8 family serine peptidase [Actinomycetospora termitidis]|uniref:S8 family serine peptidase n=1 Tax=Actinomycetospora termitidis TaxID=3053470 RepID=A0ABT7MFM2_9PSEU|nr:S8 family serine peptidase [Actinomycetospora sp. Odt1-22]MDL5158969.1 S8 family serine peptidase [Actinomycetospora sp. Odt1-22]
MDLRPTVGVGSGRWAVVVAMMAAAALLVGLAGTSSGAPAPTKRYIVVLKETVADPAATAGAQARPTRSVVRNVFATAVKGYTADIPADSVATVAGDPATQFVTEDRPIKRPRERAPKQAPPTEPCNGNSVPGYFRSCWALRVGADRSSARSGDGQGTVNVRTAVVDDGIDPNHPELNVVGGTDCLSGTATGSQVVRGSHGTNVSGVLAARDDEFGVVGIAPGAPLLGVSVFPESGDSDTSTILCALDWITRTRLDRDRGNDIEIANLSLGDPELLDTPACGIRDRDALHLAVCKAVASGVLIVASAGNETTGLRAPGTYPEVLTASAIGDYDGRPGAFDARADCFGFPYHDIFGDNDDAAAYFSNFGTRPVDRLHTVAAPGACIVTTRPGTNAVLDIVDGTSFSAPIVSGTAAVCLSSGKCRRGNPLGTLARLVTDANAYTLVDRRYGFAGDPVRPVPGRYYGPLVNVARF